MAFVNRLKNVAAIDAGEQSVAILESRVPRQIEKSQKSIQTIDFYKISTENNK